jgi:DNA polymerase-3 subunit delta
MTPQQFLAQVKERRFAPAYLFLGPEPYQREFCRNALIQAIFPDPAQREGGLARHDLAETSLDAVLDDACSLSLFASERLILVSNAEAALPKGRSGSDAAEESGVASGAAALARYVRNPTPGVALVFEAARYEFEGEDKKKAERVRKFYAGLSEVEFPRMSVYQARTLAQNLARKAGLRIEAAELDLLVEALGADAARIASEIEKLRLYAASGKPVSARDLSDLVPDARATSVFSLVNALGRRDRVRSLEELDTLVRQSEYLPLALAFLSTQFRMALAAREANLRTPQQIQAHFSRLGMPMWGSRAEQVCQTTSAFTAQQLAGALEKIYRADKSLRDARPDDRVVMEDLILQLT